MIFSKHYATPLIAMVLSTAVLLSARADALRPGAQNPAPLLAWEDWQPVGSCGGVDYLAAISKDDGRNDFELKIKIDNKTDHTVQTRLNAVIESEEGERKYRDNVGIGRLNPRRAAEACSTTPAVCFGIPFRSAVNQKTPTRIAKLTLTNIDVANIDAPPANASPAAY